MATRFSKDDLSISGHSSNDFFDVSIMEDDVCSVPPDDNFFLNENDNPNEVSEPTEEWEFLPTEFVPSSHTLVKQKSATKLATFPATKHDLLSSLRPKIRRRINLPKLLKPKRSVPETSFNSYDVVDRLEAPSTEEVEQELTQCLLHESVVIDQCLEQEDCDTKSLQYTHPSKRGSGEPFLARNDVLWQAAVNALKESVEDDQEVLGVWLLSEINHWDNESERIVMLLDDSILIAKYNFYTNVLQEVKSIGLSGIYSITHGPFSNLTPFKRRPGIGVILHWNKDLPLSVAQKWNPWSEKIPYTTFGPHPSTYKTVQCTTDSHLNIYSFLQKLKECFKTYTLERDTYVLFDDVTSLTARSSKFGIIQQIHNKANLGCDTLNRNNV